MCGCFRQTRIYVSSQRVLLSVAGKSCRARSDSILSRLVEDNPAITAYCPLVDQQWAVVNVRKDGEEIWHEVEGEPPAVGTEVTGSLAWDRRYALMRTHTALHMLAGVIWRNYGAQVTGGNMEPLRARMDFEFESMRRELVEEIEQKVNQEVSCCSTNSREHSAASTKPSPFLTSSAQRSISYLKASNRCE